MLTRMTPDEAAPVEAAPEPFDDFYSREYRPLVAILLSLTGDIGRAEDLTQDAFAEAHRRWSRIARFDKPGAWVRRVALNRSRSAWRKRQREAWAQPLVAAGAPSDGALSDESEHVWLAVRALPRRQAQCVALRYLDDRTTAEIADVLGCAEATVRVHLHRAHAALAVRLQQPEEPG
jgi:RNA polymerase sigma-70 factor (sigma-E family)